MTVSTAPAARLNEGLISACLELLRAGQTVNRKQLQQEFGVSAGTVQSARRIAMDRIKTEQAAEDAPPAGVISLEAHAQRRSPFSPGLDGQKLAQLRFLRAKMSQGELAQAVAQKIPKGKCSRVWIAKLEANRGQPSVEMFRALCEVLNCDVRDLIRDEDVERYERTIGFSAP